jgi:hypothetical protein
MGGTPTNNLNIVPIGIVVASDILCQRKGDSWRRRRSFPALSCLTNDLTPVGELGRENGRWGGQKAGRCHFPQADIEALAWHRT